MNGLQSAGRWFIIYYLISFRVESTAKTWYLFIHLRCSCCSCCCCFWQFTTRNDNEIIIHQIAQMIWIPFSWNRVKLGESLVSNFKFQILELISKLAILSRNNLISHFEIIYIRTCKQCYRLEIISKPFNRFVFIIAQSVSYFIYNQKKYNSLFPDSI